MKKIALLIVFVCFSVMSYSQSLVLNGDGIYECDSVINYQDTKLIETLRSRVISLNYEIGQGTDLQIVASNYFSLGQMAGQKVKYKIRIDIKENKYRLVFTNFIIQFTKENQLKEEPLEKIGIAKKMWIKQIDKKLPKMIGALDLNISAAQKDW